MALSGGENEYDGSSEVEDAAPPTTQRQTATKEARNRAGAQKKKEREQQDAATVRTQRVALIVFEKAAALVDGKLTYDRWHPVHGSAVETPGFVSATFDGLEHLSFSGP